jgi:hypothetical protein
METQTHLEFFKALANPNRLRLVGVLAQESLSVGELAALLNLSTSTVSHHLSQLARVGLLRIRPESYYSIYSLNLDLWQAMLNNLLTPESLTALASEIDMRAYDKQVLQTFLAPDSRLRSLPRQQKKFQAVLRYAIQRFESDRRYSEREVNNLLSELHADTASLRRGLIEYKLMQRDAKLGQYWRF